MATAVRRNQGKTEFVKEVLTNDSYANAKVVNAEWQASGHPGTISETLVNKMRSEMGLTGNLRGRRADRSTEEPAEKPMYTGKKRGRKPKGEPSISITAVPSNGKPADRAPAETDARDTQLNALETDIDVLLFRVMNLGGLEEIETSLRRTRRMLYHALEVEHA